MVRIGSGGQDGPGGLCLPALSLSGEFVQDGGLPREQIPSESPEAPRTPNLHLVALRVDGQTGGASQLDKRRQAVHSHTSSSSSGESEGGGGEFPPEGTGEGEPTASSTPLGS